MDIIENEIDAKPNRKARAAGAFRAFFNFLQKPRKTLDIVSSLKATPNPRTGNDPDRSSVENCGNSSICSKAADSVRNVKTIRESCPEFSYLPEVADLTPPCRNVFLRNEIDHVSGLKPPGSLEDDVFLDDSYFEDDYLEDFSDSPNSGSEEVHQQTFTENDLYLNNLDHIDFNVDKNYNKELPEFFTPQQDIAPTSNNTNRRQRRHSLPSNLTQVSSCTVTNAPPETIEGDCPQDAFDSQQNLPYASGKPKGYIVDRAEVSNDKNENSTRLNCKHLAASDRGVSSILCSHGLVPDSPFYVMKDSNTCMCVEKENKNCNHKEFSSPVWHEEVSSRTMQTEMPNAKLANTGGYYCSLNSDTQPPITALPKQDGDESRRPTRVSIAESGYGSACRSSSSTPLTPTTPAPNPFTPMSRLRVGAILSPHSLNTLDGIRKSRPTPKRRLLPKFIFPSPKSANLKCVPESTESLEDSEASSDQTRTTGSIGLGKKAKREQSPAKITTRYDPPSRQSRSIDLNLNVSVQVIDMNNNEVPSVNRNPIPEHPNLLNGSRDQIAQTPLSHRQENQKYFTSPVTEAIHPICTSSPFHNKRNQKLQTPLRKQVLESTTPRGRKIIDVRSLSPICKQITPARIISQSQNLAKSTTEKRKKLKRRSVRTRLLFEESKSKEDFDTGMKTPQSFSGDYILLKNIANSIMSHSMMNYSIRALFDIPSLMENLQIEYAKIRNYLDTESHQTLLDFKTRIQTSMHLSKQLTITNCVTMCLLAFLLQDSKRINASLDFIFENLPKVAHQHSFLSDLAPEIVTLILSNPHCVIKNDHGFPLSYGLSEIEVFKFILKYVELTQTRYANVQTEFRIKRMLSTVVNPLVLTDLSLQRDWSRSFECGDPSRNPHIATTGPRKPHHLVFHRSPPAEKDVDYFFQPFIPSSVQSLDDLTSAVNLEDKHSALKLSSVCKDHYVLRKLYFSYRRYSGVVYISKIGMQYIGRRGRKKTVFVAPSGDACPGNTALAFKSSSSDGSREDGTGSVSVVRSTSGLIQELPGRGGCTTGGSEYADCEQRQESMTSKKTAIVLNPGEHVTGLCVLKTTAVHNVEITTSNKRRIRAHGHNDPEDAHWTSIATRQGREPSCLHAIFGDVVKMSGRSYVRNLGAVWVTMSYEDVQL